jgi:uncharacterized protein DUF6600
MPISRSVRNFSARCLAPTLLAVSLVLAPAVGTVFLPTAAQAQDAIDFRVALEGYGQWVQHPRWGEVWIPEQVPPDWQPYRLGHWVYTEEWGWYWDSEEDFGWITYHYGRWVFDRGLGWIWIPGRDWGPAFVDWRQGDDFVGWAPLPPDEYLDEDYESPDIYLFVRAGDLLAPRAYAVFLPPQERFAYYNRSFLVNRSVRLGGGAHIAVNPGVPPAFIARASGRPFRPVSIAPIVLAGTAGVAGAVILRENFRDRERTRVSIRESNRLVQPQDHFVPLKPLQKGERGQLGGSTPLAARGVGIETKSKNFGGAPQGTQLQNQGVQKQITPQGGQKNLGTGGNQIRGQEIQQNQQKTLPQQGGAQKTLRKDNSQNNQIRNQGIQQQQNTQQKTFQPKDNSQNNQIRGQGVQQQQNQGIQQQQQNTQQKTIQQQGGQNAQPRIQQQNAQPKDQQQNAQPRVQPKTPVAPGDQGKDKSKQVQ